MRSITLSALIMLTMTASAVYAADTAQPASHPKHHKPAAKSTATKSKSAPTHKKPEQMNEAKRHDLERRIEALEQKSEMQYHETDSPNGAPAAH